MAGHTKRLLAGFSPWAKGRVFLEKKKKKTKQAGGLEGLRAQGEDGVLKLYHGQSSELGSDRKSRPGLDTKRTLKSWEQM